MARTVQKKKPAVEKKEISKKPIPSGKKPVLVSQRTIRSFDGTKIGYQVIGEGKKTVVLCNGLGGTVVAWKPIYERLGQKYRFISWDYRGLFKSDLPADESRLTIRDHAQDLEFILKKEKVGKALICGWSMGVQVCLEYYRIASNRFKAMVLVNGTYGNPFHTALNNPLSRYILPKVNELLQGLAPALQPSFKPLANRVIDWQGFLQVIFRLGLAHPNLDPEIFRDVAREMISADLYTYHELMKHLNKHTCRDFLAQIKVPTLIITAEKDLMTPLKVSKEMSSLIPDAELFVVPKGSHYCLLEFPDMILLRLESFLKENYPA